MEIKDTPELNYYPISIALDTGVASPSNPQPNTPAVKADGLTLLPIAGGYILKGFLKTDNYVKNQSGLILNDDGKGGAEFAGSVIASGYIQVFKQAGIPTSLHINDIWIDTDDSNKYYVAASVGADAIAAGEWVLTNPASAWSTLADDDGNKPDNNATVGAIIVTNLSGGGTTDNMIGNDGIITNLKAQHIIAPSNFTAGEALTAGDAAYFKA